MDVSYKNWLENKEDVETSIFSSANGDPNLLQNFSEILSHECNVARSEEYPPIVEFVDAYCHERNGNSAPMDLYLKKCAAVKSKYPKPDFSS